MKYAIWSLLDFQVLSAYIFLLQLIYHIWIVFHLHFTVSVAVIITHVTQIFSYPALFISLFRRTKLTQKSYGGFHRILCYDLISYLTIFISLSRNKKWIQKS